MKMKLFTCVFLLLLLLPGAVYANQVSDSGTQDDSRFTHSLTQNLNNSVTARGRIEPIPGTDRYHTGAKFTMYVSVDGGPEVAYETNRRTGNFQTFSESFTFWPTQSVRIRVTNFEYRYGSGNWRFYNQLESITLRVGIVQ